MRRPLDADQRRTVIEWHEHGRSVRLSPPPIFSYLIFAPVLSLFSIAYLELAPRLAPRASHPLASLAVETTNTVFYFVGFIVLAVYLTRLVYCYGSVCAAGRAMSVVAAVQFTSWIATTILLAKTLFKGGLPADFDVAPRGSRAPRPQQRQSDSEAPVYRCEEDEEEQAHSPQMRQV